MTPLSHPRDARIFLYPILAFPLPRSVSRFSDGFLTRNLQVAINFPPARKRVVLPATINQATEFQFGATSRSHAENSHYETHVVNQWNRSPLCPKRKNAWTMCTVAMYSVIRWMRTCILTSYTYFVYVLFDDFRSRVKRFYTYKRFSS